MSYRQPLCRFYWQAISADKSTVLIIRLHRLQSCNKYQFYAHAPAIQRQFGVIFCEPHNIIDARATHRVSSMKALIRHNLLAIAPLYHAPGAMQGQTARMEQDCEKPRDNALGVMSS